MEAPKKFSKRWLFELVDPGTYNSDKSDWFDKTILALIFLNVVAVILESVPEIGKPFVKYFYVFDIVSVGIFTFEYLMRLWLCTIDEHYKGSIAGRIKFITSPYGIIDLLAILPFYLPAIIPIDLRFIRILRMLRLFQVFKLPYYSNTLQKLTRVLKHKKYELITTFGLILILLIFSSSIIYYVENPVQPDKYSSIPASMWWAAITLTTIGYGDIFPVTALGKFFTMIIAMLGVVMVAIPTGIISSGFIEDDSKYICKHCGNMMQCDD
jgi:voltage-gated potassium channel